MGKVLIDESVVTFYRRSLKPADSLLSNAGENPAPALDNRVIDVADGDWLTLNDAGEAIKMPAASQLPAYMAWVGQRRDSAAAERVTVIFGVFSGLTSVFDSGGSYAAGTLLTAEDGQLLEAASGDFVVAIAEGAVKNPTDDYPDGFLPFTTVGAGHKLP